MENIYDARGNAVQRYIYILTNGGFKALFGDVNNKEYHYDFMCRDEDGAIYIVEMQRYASRAYDRQNRMGEDYDVPPVYLIGLMGTEILHQDPGLWNDRFISEYTFREKKSGEVLDETIIIIFAELARFSKPCEECVSDIDKMLYLLKNMGNLKNRPEWPHREVYAKIFDACEIARFDEDKRIKYEQDMYDQRRLNGEFAAARRQGVEEGIKTTAIKMLELSMPVEVIASVTGMTQDQIKALRIE